MPISRPRLSVIHNTSDAPPSAASTLLRRSLRSSSGTSTVSSRGACVTPMRTSTAKNVSVTDNITHYDAVEGYVFPTSVVQGEAAQLRVSTGSTRFDVRVERWGVRREWVWSADDVAGVEQPTPDDADAAGCGWQPV